MVFFVSLLQFKIVAYVKMAYTLDNDVNILKIIRNHQVSESLCKLYLNDDMSDVFFVFTNDNDETIQRLPAHRLILAAASPVFHQMFYGDLPEGAQVIISDCSHDGFAEFLQYFYLTDITFSSDNVFEVIQMAEKYDLPDLISMCHDFLNEYLSCETVFLTLHIALVYDIKELKANCERLICNDAKSVLAAEAFPYCSPIVLKEILSLPGINVSEVELLDAAMQWATHACLTNSDETPTIEQCKRKLGDCFNLIRFETMTTEELSTCVFRYPGMFDTVELERKLMNLGIHRYINSSVPRLKHLFNDDGFIVCSRIASRRSTMHLLNSKQVIRFSVSTKIILHAIQIAQETRIPEFPRTERIPITGHILRVSEATVKRKVYAQSIEIDLNRDNLIKMRRPITIDADKDYNIVLILNTKATHFSTIELRRDPIGAGGLTEFTFKEDEDANYDNVTRGIITDLWFKLSWNRICIILC